MANFRNTKLWLAAFESELASAHRTEVDRLIAVFDAARRRTEFLSGEIASDLPNYTVHGIRHIDALWETGSEITGATFSINPVEGFVLGCAFLFHDAALTVAAYPGGIDSVRQTPEWKRVLGKMKSKGDEPTDAVVLEMFLRAQHAVQAKKLLETSWKNGEEVYFLIDDPDYRRRFGDAIGTIASSHWWDHSELEKNISNRIIPVPAPFPSGWTIDVLKLACVLRTADVGQLDERRAPGFLKALRHKKLSEYSERHWKFQSNLTQPQNRGDTLYFASLKPFPKVDAQSWWLLFDTLKMVDHELRRTDDLLLRFRGEESRFSARKVANVDSPESLTSSVATEGWRPVDTSFSISDIPQLVENLGGGQLYGRNSFAAVRELVQNAMDATRLRDVVDNDKQDRYVLVEIEHSAEGTYLVVRDTGVGMSVDQIVNNLLSFGRSGWLTDGAIAEFNDDFPSKDAISGRFGIGFFSIFMLGDYVRILTRRFDAPAEETLILEFQQGLNQRPLLYSAAGSDRRTNGGTEVRVRLDLERLEQTYWQSIDRLKFWTNDNEGRQELEHGLSRCFPISDVPIHVIFEQEKNVIDGRNWKTEPASKLLARIEGKNYSKYGGAIAYEKALTNLEDDEGRILGRACLIPDTLFSRHRWVESGLRGSVVSNGAHVCDGVFRGVVLGVPTRAARDFAEPIPSWSVWQNWATEQAKLLEGIASNPDHQIEIAEQVACLGGDVCDLKVCKIGETALTLAELRSRLRNLDEIWVADNSSLRLSRPDGIASNHKECTVSVSGGLRQIIHRPIWAGITIPAKGMQLSDVVELEICDVFGLDRSVFQTWNKVEDGRHVHRAKVPAWHVIETGATVEADGTYWKRGMTVQDVAGYPNVDDEDDD